MRLGQDLKVQRSSLARHVHECARERALHIMHRSRYKIAIAMIVRVTLKVGTGK